MNLGSTYENNLSRPFSQMSIYITTENQTLLWNTVKKIALFEKLSTEEREPWFREIIQKFYENNRFKTLSLTELKQLNRDTITYMMNALKEIDHRTTFSYEPYPSSHGTSPSTFSSALSLFPLQHQPVVNFPTNDVTALKQTDEVTRNFFSNQKKDTLNKQFLERRQEYETMNQKVVPEIDFRLSTEDNGPIGQTSMEEMVRQQTAMREMPLLDTSMRVTAPVIEKLTIGSDILPKPTEPLQSSMKKMTVDKMINPPEKKAVRWQTDEVVSIPFNDISFDADQKNTQRNTNMHREYIMETSDERHRSPLRFRYHDDKLNLSRLKEEIRQELQKEMKKELYKEVDGLKRMINRGEPSTQLNQNLMNSIMFQQPANNTLSVSKVREPKNILFDTPYLLEDVVPVDIVVTEFGEMVQFSRDLV